MHNENRRTWSVWLEAAALIGLAAAAGCVESEATPCGDTVCARGWECDRVHLVCVRPSQLVDCQGRDDGEPCEVEGSAGFHCDQEVCIAGECGDGVRDVGEECDDGAQNSDTAPGACRATGCLLPRCGDGVVDQGEECDEGSANSDTTPNACRTSCASAGCGDGVKDSGEGCDDANQELLDGCESCQTAMFRANVYDVDSQGGGDVAMSSTGEFVVAWHCLDRGRILVRLFCADGFAVGGEIEVGESASTNLLASRIALANDGGFVVVYQGSDGDGDGIWARRFLPGGTPEGDPFQVNTQSAGDQLEPDVSAAPDGRFVVVWQQGASPFGVAGQLYSSSGTKVGGEIAVSATGYPPRVGMAADGSFVVAWAYGSDVNARRYDAAGTPIGSAVVAGTSFYGGGYGDPSVGSDASGGFVVAWPAREDGSNYQQILARRFEASGAPAGEAFRVDGDLSNHPGAPSVAVSPAGRFAIAWRDGLDASDAPLMLRRYTAGGQPSGVSSEIPFEGHVSMPEITSGNESDLVLVWEGWILSWDVYGIRLPQ